MEEKLQENVQKKKKKEQPGRMPMCVSPSKCASYFSSVAEDVRTSSALLPALAPGEIITSSSACDVLQAIWFKKRSTDWFLLKPTFFCLWGSLSSSVYLSLLQKCLTFCGNYQSLETEVEHKTTIRTVCPFHDG